MDVNLIAEQRIRRVVMVPHYIKSVRDANKLRYGGDDRNIHVIFVGVIGEFRFTAKRIRIK